MLRLIGLVLVLVYTGIGAMLLAGSDGASTVVGVGLVLTGLTWLVIDVLKRRAVIWRPLTTLSGRVDGPGFTGECDLVQ